MAGMTTLGFMRLGVRWGQRKTETCATSADPHSYVARACHGIHIPGAKRGLSDLGPTYLGQAQRGRPRRCAIRPRSDSPVLTHSLTKRPDQPRHMRILTTFAISIALVAASHAMPKPSFHTAGTPAGKPTGSLKPGEYWWNPKVSPSGPLMILVSVPEQVMHVYRNG